MTPAARWGLLGMFFSNDMFCKPASQAAPGRETPSPKPLLFSPIVVLKSAGCH